MKIVIISGSFYPSIHPRAFRAAELAKELAREGHNVTAVFFKRDDTFNYEQYEKEINVELIPFNIFGKGVSKASNHKRTVCFRVKRFLIEYLLCGKLFLYGKQIKEALNTLDCFRSADMVIAMSTPFPVHYGFYKYMKEEGKHYIAIADSGDPFYYSKQTPRAIWFKYIERNIYKLCDYITIPTANAIDLYSPICPKEKIKVIPQGFDMTHLNLFTGEFGIPLKFAYAGVFYWDIRNPEFLFKYLNGQKLNYEFHVFMRYKDTTFIETLDKYPNLKRKTIIRYGVPHDDLIYELSKMNFLINIENLSNTQMPSKLIDYGMVKRPILSCNEINFKEEWFKEFLYGNYVHQYKVSIDDFDIRNVAAKFMKLISTNK